MEIIYRKKGDNKTTELIKLAAENNYYMVCFDQGECSRVFHQSLSMDLDIPFPITFSEFIDGKYYAFGINGFCIDNVDMLLGEISQVKIGAITITRQ